MSASEPWVRAALGFARTCLASSHLHAHAGRFDPDGAGAPLREAVARALERFRSDQRRYRLQFEAPEALFAHLELAHHLQASFFYRVYRELFLAGIEELPDLLFAVSRQMTAIEIYYSADIGPGLKLIHGAGTVIGARSRIGADFTVYQNVTIGDKLGRDTGPRPVLGDRVIASAGAQVLGGVEVGSQVVIGANAVVLDSLPDRCVAAGIPARVCVADLDDARFGEFWDSLKG